MVWVIAMMLPFVSYGQLEESISAFENIINQIVQLAPTWLLAGFLVGALLNVGKIWGQDKDYVGFFKGAIIYVVAVAVIIGIAAWIRSVQF